MRSWTPWQGSQLPSSGVEPTTTTLSPHRVSMRICGKGAVHPDLSIGGLAELLSRTKEPGGRDTVGDATSNERTAVVLGQWRLTVRGARSRDFEGMPPEGPMRRVSLHSRADLVWRRGSWSPDMPEGVDEDERREEKL